MEEKTTTEAGTLKRRQAVMLFLITIWAALAFGSYRGSIAAAESTHFSLNFPATTKQQAGGIGPLGHEGRVVMNLAKAGYLKRAVQPGVVNISSHWIRNKGKRPYRIKLSLVNCDYPVEWITSRKDWDAAGKTLAREIKPGETVSMDWNITVPEKALKKKVVYDGGVAVVDAATGRWLSYLPVKIINTKDGKIPKEANCCGP